MASQVREGSAWDSYQHAEDKPVSLRMNSIIFWRGREDRRSKLKPS